MKKILILGGSHSELPLVQEAKKLGLYVITVGNILGNAHLRADEYHLLDYSDKKFILQFAKQQNIDYICFGAHDLSMTTTAYIAQELGFENFDSYETTLKLHHKDEFKSIALKYNLNTPKALWFTQKDKIDISPLNFPLIIKPTDMGGGKGISVIDSIDNLLSATNLAFGYSKCKNIIIEEFFEGSLHSFSTFIVDKKVKFYHSDNEYPCPHNPYGVCASLAPADNFDTIKLQLIQEVERVSNILNLKDGLLHMQYLQNNDTFTVVEYTRRMPGDLYNIPVEMCTNFPYAKNIILAATRQPLIWDFEDTKKIVSRYCVTDDYPTKLIPYIKDQIKILNSNKKEILFLEFDTKEQFLNQL
jgi:phosphoribosylamine-glycine ligase